MCEAQDIIKAVKKYPSIWNINSTDYYNRDVKDLAWQQVCKEVYNDWETCTDKTNKCADLKKKWTNIRDYYRKELQKKGGCAAKNKKKYKYGKLLYFLTPIFARRNSESQLPSQYEEVTIKQEEIDNLEKSPTPPMNTKTKKDDPTQILNILQHRQETTNTSSNVTEDDDTKFLLSFRSYMKKMTTDQKIEFQLGMLQLVKRINAGSYPSSSSPLQYSDSS